MWRIVTKCYYTGLFSTRSEAKAAIEELGYKIVAGIYERKREGRTERACIDFIPEYRELSEVKEKNK